MRTQIRTSGLLGLLAALGWVGCSGEAPEAPVGGQLVQALNGVPNFDHVLVVIDENHSYASVVGSSAAPYINGTLIAHGALFTNSVALTHPSQPNYLHLFSGSAQGVTDDTCPPPGAPYTTANLAFNALAAGRSFAGYSEDLPSAGSTSCGVNGYARKHNPWVDWQGSGSNQVPASVNQPFSSFPSDFSTLPSVSFVVPNLTDDMHDGTVAQGDAWLASHIDSYAQWATTHNSLLILTFDEDDGGSSTNQIPTVFFGANVQPGSYGEAVNHHRVLRTIEDVFGLAHAGAAANETPITDCWTSGSGGTGGSGGTTGGTGGSGGTSGSSSALSRWRGSNDATNNHYSVYFSQPFTFYRVYIDTDESATTGFAVAGIGADYLIENGVLYSHGAAGWNWNSLGSSSQVLGSNSSSWTIPRATLGQTAYPNSDRLSFEAETSGNPIQNAGAYEHVYSASSGAITGYFAENDASNVYYTANFTQNYTYKHVFIDADRNAATGYAWDGIGADYMIENDTLFRSTGSGWSWTAIASTPASGGSGSAGVKTWTVPRATIGETAPSGETANIVFDGSGGPAEYIAPLYLHVYTQ